MGKRQRPVENMELNTAFWRGKRVLVTGHTGFKGAWLTLWLHQMGAEVFGLALAPSTSPNLYELAGLDQVISSKISDVTDRAAVGSILTENKIEIVFHLAAQALVRASYDDPVFTFATNTVGVATLLDQVRRSTSVKAVIVVTSDKCYQNNDWPWGYREIDRLAGRDPYSASKSCAELVTLSMQKSFFAPFAKDGHPAKIATARSGNVIGGGDWALDRLVPDIVRGALGASREVHLRNPGSVRPWLHVLEPLTAYIGIAELLFEGGNVDEAWNIGPDLNDNHTVDEVAQALIAKLGMGFITYGERGAGPQEASYLTLDCSKIKSRLGWTPCLTFDETLELTASWYLAWSAQQNMADVTRQQIKSFQARIRSGSATERQLAQSLT